MREDGRLIYIVMFLFASVCFAETNWNLQAVNEYGLGTYPEIGGPDKITVEGIILNRPDQMTAIDVNEEWQIFIQGGPGDHAGTAVYMRKNNFGPTYTDQQWAAELYRISHDPNNHHWFSPGDKVRVTGLLMFYAGKTNVNEQHSIDPNNDFTIKLIDPNAGLPEPELITLSMVKDSNNNFIFDHTRVHGCELYQGVLVRVNNVNIISGTWQPNSQLVIEDGSGRTFNVKLGFGAGFTRYPMPTGKIDVIGIFDQQAPGEYPDFDLKAGYRLWVMNYDGNGSVLVDEWARQGYLAADVNIDGITNFVDLAVLAENWLKYSN
jgi:hypothetical protein